MGVNQQLNKLTNTLTFLMTSERVAGANGIAALAYPCEHLVSLLITCNSHHSFAFYTFRHKFETNYPLAFKIPFEIYIYVRNLRNKYNY